MQLNLSTLDNPYDVERALSIIENGQQTTSNVYVAGSVSRIEEVNLQYGNATYYIAQGEREIYVYRGKGIDGADFVDDDEIAVGDAVVLAGVLKYYKGTYEITNSSIVSISRQISDPGLVYVYTYDTHTAYRVSGYDSSLPVEVSIPSAYNGVPVVEIGSSALAGCDDMTLIEIPSSVTSIGNNAFGSCGGLTSVTV